MCGICFFVPCTLAMWCHFNITIRTSQDSNATQMFQHHLSSSNISRATSLISFVALQRLVLPHHLLPKNLSCDPPSSVQCAVLDGKSMGSVNTRSTNRLDTLSTVDIYIYRNKNRSLYIGTLLTSAYKYIDIYYLVKFALKLWVDFHNTSHHRWHAYVLLPFD